MFKALHMSIFLHLKATAKNVNNWGNSCQQDGSAQHMGLQGSSALLSLTSSSDNSCVCVCVWEGGWLCQCEQWDRQWDWVSLVASYSNIQITDGTSLTHTLPLDWGQQSEREGAEREREGQGESKKEREVEWANGKSNKNPDTEWKEESCLKARSRISPPLSLSLSLS